MTETVNVHLRLFTARVKERPRKQRNRAGKREKTPTITRLSYPDNIDHILRILTPVNGHADSKMFVNCSRSIGCYEL